MTQVDYNFYKENYAGRIIPDELAFKQPVMKAKIYLEQCLHRKPEEKEDQLVKLCLCEISELIYQEDTIRQEHRGMKIQSENTDGYSVSYASGEEESLDKRIYMIIRRYLSRTGLLYLGVNCHAHKLCDFDI
mgnify:CR=1 FL=1